MMTVSSMAASQGCRVETQLAYSMNGRAWVRSLRAPLFGNGPNGSATHGLNCPGPRGGVKRRSHGK
jgi:hypothetical protein